MREHVETAAVRHPDDDFVRARVGCELDRLVEHRHHHVEALDRELLLAEERAAEVELHPFDLAQSREQRDALLVGERLPVHAGLDRLPQPDPLLVIGDVLDLVGDRPAVDLAQPGQRVGERLALDIETEQLAPGSAPAARASASGSAAPARGRDRLPAPSRADRDAPRDARACGRPSRATPPRRSRRAAPRRQPPAPARAGTGGTAGAASTAGAVAVAVRLEAVEQQGEARLDRDELVAVAALEDRAPLVGNRSGIVEVLLEDEGRVARVQSVYFGPDAITTFVAARARYQSGRLVTTAIVRPRKKQAAVIITAAKARRL